MTLQIRLRKNSKEVLYLESLGLVFQRPNALPVFFIYQKVMISKVCEIK